MPRPVPTVPSGDDEEERERLRREAEEEELERQRREEEERRRIELLRLQSAITLQSWYRCVQQMRSFHHELREHRAATKIQSHWRRVVATRKVSFIQKENNYRKRVITELWQTEQSYLQSLELLLEVHERASERDRSSCALLQPLDSHLTSLNGLQVYHTPLSQNGLLSDDKRQSLFSNVDSIFQLHTVLLQQLEPKLLPERTPTAERGWFPHRKIAHIFLALVRRVSLSLSRSSDAHRSLCAAVHTTIDPEPAIQAVHGLREQLRHGCRVVRATSIEQPKVSCLLPAGRQESALQRLELAELLDHARATITAVFDVAQGRKAAAIRAQTARETDSFDHDTGHSETHVA